MGLNAYIYIVIILLVITSSKKYISAVILLFDISCRNPDWLSIIYFPKSKPKTLGGNPAMGEDLLYSRLSPLGEKLLYSQFSGGETYYGGKTAIQPALWSNDFCHQSPRYAVSSVYFNEMLISYVYWTWKCAMSVRKLHGLPFILCYELNSVHVNLLISKWED
jgi:hypothetical protein